MIIKAARLQAWTPAGEGKSRPSPPPPPQKKIKKSFLTILGAFLLHFLHMGAVLLRFSHFWGPFCYFLLHSGGLFLGLPPPPPTKISAGAHDCKEGSRACSPEIFLYDRNLVSSGHVLLRFCLKNDKNSDKL